MNLKEYRKSLGITIYDASLTTGVPLRTYIRYENNDQYGNSLKRNQIFLLLKQKYEITDEKGILSIDKIKENVKSILDKRSDKVLFCYLFGSYAKGYAKDDSDVDLCLSTSISGSVSIEIISSDAFVSSVFCSVTTCISLFSF